MQGLNDPRIIILEGEFFGDFLTFADTLMPNFNNVDNYEEVASALNKLLNNNGEISAVVSSDQNPKV